MGALAQHAMSQLPKRASGWSWLHGVWIVVCGVGRCIAIAAILLCFPINSDMLFVAYRDWLAAAHCGTSRAFGRNCMRGQM